MPKLRDCFLSDIETFINQNEFADMHDINGQKSTVYSMMTHISN